MASGPSPSSQTKLDRAGDGGGVALELVGRGERVAGAGHEQDRHVDVGEVLDAQVVGLARRVERVAEQDEAGDGFALGGQHRAHAAAEGPATDDQLGRVRPQPVGEGRHVVAELGVDLAGPPGTGW